MRHLEKARSGEGVYKCIGRKPVLSIDQETELKAIIFEMEASLFGLTRNDVRQFVFKFCETKNIKNNFNQASQRAGKDWLNGYLKRHPAISMRIPEPTSIQRAMGFNKPKVDRYMKLLEATIFDESGNRAINEGNIFNVDESGFTICHKPGKVLAKKGKKGVGAITSAERGKNVTVVACISATGVYIPPMMIFPRVRMKPELLDGSPPDTVGYANKSGWINAELFECWLDHFIATVQPSHRTSKVLLILDGHSSHTKSVQLIEKAKANNIIIISLPSHCTHRLQPLDVSVFKSVNVNYNRGVQTWLRQHPGRSVTEFQIAALFGSAYTKAATVSNAISGFRKCGINPFNPHIFSDDDFAASDVTDMRNPAAGLPLPQPNPTAVCNTSGGPSSTAVCDPLADLSLTAVRDCVSTDLSLTAECDPLADMSLTAVRDCISTDLSLTAECDPLADLSLTAVRDCISTDLSLTAECDPLADMSLTAVRDCISTDLSLTAECDPLADLSLTAVRDCISTDLSLTAECDPLADLSLTAVRDCISTDMSLTAVCDPLADLSLTAVRDCISTDLSLTAVRDCISTDMSLTAECDPLADLSLTAVRDCISADMSLTAECDPLADLSLTAVRDCISTDMSLTAVCDPLADLSLTAVRDCISTDLSLTAVRDCISTDMSLTAECDPLADLSLTQCATVYRRI